MDARKEGAAQLHAFDNETRMTPVRRRALTTIALGEFVDGFDLIVIGGALLLLGPQFGLSAGMTGVLSAVAFTGSAAGALFFGDLTDRVGRRRVFVVNLIAFVVLALASAAITEVWMLIVARIMIGVAIGADISASMAFLAELSPRASRGGWTGAMPQIMWSLGALAATLVDALLYVVGGPEAWRLMFAVGAIPALVVLMMRRSLPDSPRWLLARGRVDEAVAAFREFGVTVRDKDELVRVLRPGTAEHSGTGSALVRGVRPYLRIFEGRLLGPALFAILVIGLTPLTAIGQSILGPYVLKQFGHMSPAVSLLSSALIWVGALFGSYIAWKTLDRVGRIRSIVIALAGTIVVYALMVTVARGNPGLVPLYFVLGALTWYGSSAWWPLPSELLPTAVRGRAQGLGSGLQRVMIAANVFLVPVLLDALGFVSTVLISCAVAVVLLPYVIWGRRYEPSARSLDETSGDELFASRPEPQSRSAAQPQSESQPQSLSQPPGTEPAQGADNTPGAGSGTTGDPAAPAH